MKRTKHEQHQEEERTEKMKHRPQGNWTEGQLQEFLPEDAATLQELNRVVHSIPVNC